MGLLAFSGIGMVVNVGLYLTGVIGEKELIFVTLVLSWLALVWSAVDALFIVQEGEES